MFDSFPQELSRSRKRGLNRRLLKCAEDEDEDEDEEEESGSKRARRDSSSRLVVFHHFICCFTVDIVETSQSQMFLCPWTSSACAFRFSSKAIIVLFSQITTYISFFPALARLCQWRCRHCFPMVWLARRHLTLSVEKPTSRWTRCWAGVSPFLDMQPSP